MKRPGLCIKRTWVVAILFFSLVGLADSAQAQKFQFSIFGGINHVFQYGSEENYVLGENDFPVTLRTEIEYKGKTNKGK